MVRNEWPLSRAKNSHQILHEVKQNLKWGTWHVKGSLRGSRKRAAGWHQEHSRSSGTRLKWGHHLQDWWKSEKVRTGVCTNRQFSASMMTEDFSKGGRTDLFGDSTAGGEFLPHTCGAFDSWPGTARTWRLPGSLREAGHRKNVAGRAVPSISLVYSVTDLDLGMLMEEMGIASILQNVIKIQGDFV